MVSGVLYFTKAQHAGPNERNSPAIHISVTKETRSASSPRRLRLRHIPTGKATSDESVSATNINVTYGDGSRTSTRNDAAIAVAVKIDFKLNRILRFMFVTNGCDERSNGYEGISNRRRTVAPSLAKI